MAVCAIRNNNRVKDNMSTLAQAPFELVDFANRVRQMNVPLANAGLKNTSVKTGRPSITGCLTKRRIKQRQPGNGD